jgi:hypothetical protein
VHDVLGLRLSERRRGENECNREIHAHQASSPRVIRIICPL